MCLPIFQLKPDMCIQKLCSYFLFIYFHSCNAKILAGFLTFQQALCRIYPQMNGHAETEIKIAMSLMKLPS